MIEDYKKYIEKYVALFKPVEYEGLKLRPVLVEDAYIFKDACDILMIEKNKIPDIKVIQASYLYFLFSIILSQKEVLDKFLTIANLCFGIDFNAKNMVDGDFEPNELLIKTTDTDTQIFFINGWDIAFEIKGQSATLFIEDKKITAQNFEELRKIILFQNLYDYDDMQMSDDFRRVIEDYYRIKNKGRHIPNLEEKEMVVIVNTSYTMETIKEIPLRTFELLFNYSIGKVDYLATMPLLPNLKEAPEHWVYRHEKEKYAEIFSDAQEMVNKVTSI